jgi:hypothetical protein
MFGPAFMCLPAAVPRQENADSRPGPVVVGGRKGRARLRRRQRGGGPVAHLGGRGGSMGWASSAQFGQTREERGLGPKLNWVSTQKLI